MRQIKKQAPPAALTEWIAANQNGPNCGYGSVSSELRKIIRESLVAEQGCLCAYSGRKIDVDSCHIEHLKPQAHCQGNEDVTYRNLVAAVPTPNAPKLPYGAHLKDNWPSDDEQALFVSPLQDGCAARFSYNFRGEIRPANPADEGAKETIKRLGLDHSILVAFRREAINRTLQAPKKGTASLDPKAARRRMKDLQKKDAGAAPLEPFSFALINALENHIERVQKLSAKKKKA
ncbi:MAG: hypothetical protein ACI9KA_000007 [Parasphingorhabdus sp.]|jgi:uncharacterized protein (TIGR02646 family)|uniref:retron system putative HNH endonuclease n=1 Tax=Parasphingorhabdus sp. TaxID=2709688 RepID=UPI0039E23A91